MDGLELIGRIRTRWNIPVVLVSGFEKSALPPAMLDTKGIYYVAKPYLPFQLREAIAKCLV
jgi:CheY-like chemotaxis protein